MVFDVHILGSGSATPQLHRNMTAQYVNVLERHIMIDCAEGTQLQFQKFRIKPFRIDYILISHLHGDHYLGLVGFLSSQHLFGRKKPLKIFAPTALQDIIFSQLAASKTTLGYDIEFVGLESKESELIFEDNVIEIYTIPLEHRVYCNGYLIREKIKPRRINKPVCDQYKVPIAMMHLLIKGHDWVKDNGVVVQNTELTFPPVKSRSYAFCSDTRYAPKNIEQLKNVDLLYHEATFMHEMLDRAKKTFHSTALQAATFAKEAEVKQLIMGHFSVRYREVDCFEEEAKAVFPNSKAVNDGDKYSIPLEK
jgi:ribonuclease Z